MHHAGSRAAILLVLGLSLVAPAARAQSAADRESARTLLLAGREKFTKGDYEGALKDFKAAHAIMGVPTTGLDLAKAQVATGLLVEGRDTALAVARTAPAPAEPAAFAKARTAAAQLAEQVATRIASITIRLEGPAKAAEVTLDGVAMRKETLGVPWRINPGEHTIVAESTGFAVHKSKVTFGEGESRTVSIQLERLPTVAQPAPVARAPASGGTPAWAWAALGVGAAAGATAVVFAIDYAAAQSTIADDCPNGVCDPTRYTLAEVESLEARRSRSGILAIGLGAGGLVALGVGGYGLLSARGSADRGTVEHKAAGATRGRWVAVGPGPSFVCGGRF